MDNISTSKTGFRYDINALRAFAVLGVVLFHYKVSFFDGGFAGVDVFFVISGYLMTKIIITSINYNRFSFKDYIEKRVRRIVPALLFLIIILSVVCFFFYFPENYKINQLNTLASITFLSNILYWQSANSYFAPSSDTNLFLHTWSLSVEWQFYLIYPLILLLLSKTFKNKQFFLLFFACFTVALAAASFIATAYKGNASFYLLPTRSWEMMFGGIAFLAENTLKGYKWREITASIGYILILACFLLLDTKMPWPGLYTLMPVIATFSVIIANSDSIKFTRYNGVQFLGKISYSLYLWHWPVYVIAQYFGIKTSLKSIPLLILASILLGYLSFTYIESIKIKNLKQFYSLAISTGIIVAISSHFNINYFIFKPKSLELANYDNTHQKNRDKQFNTGICFAEPQNEAYNINKCLCLDEHKKNILLLGDSHAAQLSESLRKSLDSSKFNLLQATAGGILPTVKKTDNERPNIRKIIDYIYEDFIPNNASKIHLVILTAHWAGAINVKKEDVLRGIKESVDYFNKKGIKVIIIGQSESYIIPYPIIAGRNYEYNIQVNRNYLNNDNYLLNDYMAKNLGSTYIKIINHSSFPPLSSRNEPYMRDDNHVTEYGASLIINKIFSNPTAIKSIY